MEISVGNMWGLSKKCVERRNVKERVLRKKKQSKRLKTV